MLKVIIINGPNLNIIEQRGYDLYGYETLEKIKGACLTEAIKLNFFLDFRQTNSEAEIIDWLQNVNGNYDGVLINAAGYSHTSIAIMDALLTVKAPIIEVHLSNIFSREDYRSKSYIAKVARGTICGFHGYGYVLALQAMKNIFQMELVNDSMI